VRFAHARQGSRLEIKSRPVEFSYWPVRRSTRRYGMNTSVYSNNPWPLLSRVARQDAHESVVDDVLAFLDQARDFARAASAAETRAAKPLLLYYSYLNLAKAYINLRDPSLANAKAIHGLSENVVLEQQGLAAARIRAFPRPPDKKVNVFDELLRTVTGSGLARTTDFPVSALLPQVVAGHRLWCSAVAANEERFIGLEDITFWQDKDRREVWLRLHLFADEVRRVAQSHGALLEEARLDATWQSVQCTDTISGRKLSRLEMKEPVSYSGRAADHLSSLVESLRSNLWAVVRNARPHRRFYLYLAPEPERAYVLPQLLSIYALAFYFGHLTRYKPSEYRKLLDGDYGPWIESFLSESPHQFIYLLSSDFCSQDITSVGIPM